MQIAGSASLAPFGQQNFLQAPTNEDSPEGARVASEDADGRRLNFGVCIMGFYGFRPVFQKLFRETNRFGAMRQALVVSSKEEAGQCERGSPQ